MTDSGTKCACVIHESKAVQIYVHNNRRCLYVPRVPGSVKNPHNNNNNRCVVRALTVTMLGRLGHWQTVQTQIRHGRTVGIISSPAKNALIDKKFSQEEQVLSS